MQNTLEVLVAFSVNFYENGILSRGIVALHYLGNLFQYFDHLVEQTRFFKKDADERTGVVTNHRRVQDKLRPFDDAHVLKLLDSLMNGGTRHVAFASHFQKGNSRILGNELQDFSIQAIELRIVVLIHDVLFGGLENTPRIYVIF